MHISPIRSTYTSTLVISFFLSVISMPNHNLAVGSEQEKYFSDNEYAHFTRLIYEANLPAYEKLKKCEALISRPCIEKCIDKEPERPDKLVSFLPASEETQGCPIILLDPKLMECDEEYSKVFLSEKYLFYYICAEITSITQNERAHTLQIIKSIDLQLYEEITTIDPHGSEHIKRYYNNEYGFAVYPSKEDGLPVFLIGKSIMELPRGERQFCLGHELGHYVLGYFHENIKHKLRHAILSTKQSKSTVEFAKGKRVYIQLRFEFVFNDAFNRIHEYEADKFAALDLGLSIDDGIAIAKRWATRSNENAIPSPHKATFYRSHPLWSARIQHLNDLRREVEMRSTRKKQPQTKINWKELAKDYLKMYEEVQ